MRKLLKISTHMFDLTIRWNSAVMGLQGAIIFGVIMLKLFSSNENVEKLCVVILLFDLLVIVFLLLAGLHVSIEDADGNDIKEQKPVTEVNRHATVKSEQKPTQKKSGTSKVIGNKVPTPVQKQQVQQPEPTKDVPVQSSPTPKPDMSNKTVEEMSESDWEALFKMDEE